MSRKRWTPSYGSELERRFKTLTDGLGDRIDEITQARTAPAVGDIVLGSGRRTRATVLFFDICGFTDRTSEDDADALGETLYMLDCVIPMIMHVIFDHGGYVEKNTGDGVMALVGVGEDPTDAVDSAIDMAVVALWVMEEVVNPHLANRGIEPVQLSIGIDHGHLLLARIGTHRGGSAHERSFLTAVGPTANIAFKLQVYAGANEILVGGLVFLLTARRSDLFTHVLIPDWSWTLGDDHYLTWNFTGRRVEFWT